MTALLTAVALGLVIGAVLGGLGGGGAIITVPALVYVVGQSGQEATTSSLVIVGATALTGTLSYVSTGRVRWGTAFVFSGAGLPTAWLGSYLNQRVDENVLLLGFSALMLVAAAAMAADQRQKPASNGATGSPVLAQRAARHREAGRERQGTATAVLEPQAERVVRPAALAVVAAALAVGFLTGFFGVGGGFVIVPALVLVLRMPMDRVVGTSLMVVALNSGTSLVSRASSAHFDWSVILPLTVSAALATVLGKRVADRLPARRLKLAFAGLLVLVAAYTAWQSVLAIGEDTGSAVQRSSVVTTTAESATDAVRFADVLNGGDFQDLPRPHDTGCEAADQIPAHSRHPWDLDQMLREIISGCSRECAQLTHRNRRGGTEASTDSTECQVSPPKTPRSRQISPWVNRPGIR